MRAVDENRFELSTGKTFYACLNVLSVTDDGRLVYGFDGTVEDEEDEEVVFTDVERAEISEFMIERWRAWARSR